MAGSINLAKTLIENSEYELVVHREPSGKGEFVFFECEDSRGRLFKVSIEQVDELEDHDDSVEEEEEAIEELSF